MESVEFTFEGVIYAIDLNERHLKEMRSDFTKWSQHARRIGGRRKARSNGKATVSTMATSAEIRAWAKLNGWPDISSRGRVPVDATEAYNAHVGS